MTIVGTDVKKLRRINTRRNVKEMIFWLQDGLIEYVDDNLQGVVEKGEA